MAVREPRDLLSRLADAGEEAIQRLADTPGGDRLVGVATSLRDRLDEMQRRMLGLDAIEKRVAELERRLVQLEGGKETSTARKATGAKRSASRARKTTSTSASSTSKASNARTRSSSSRKTS